MFWCVAPSNCVTVTFGRQVFSSNEMMEKKKKERKKIPDAIYTLSKTLN